jgi:hypothetical protein
MTLVKGLSLVPNPAARIMAFIKEVLNEELGMRN